MVHPMKKMRLSIETSRRGLVSMPPPFSYEGRDQKNKIQPRLVRNNVFDEYLKTSNGLLGKRTTSCRSMGENCPLYGVEIVTPIDSPATRKTTLSLEFTRQRISPTSLPPPPFVSRQSQQAHEAKKPLKMLSMVCSRPSSKKQVHESYAGSRNEAGQKHGKGIMHYSNGCRYVGSFVNDKRDGFGKCFYANGCCYTGLWRDGKRDGIGKMIYFGRDVYEGKWMADRRHGQGTYFWSDGRTDVCQYFNHNVVGEGTHWSACRRKVWRLVDGKNMGPVSLREGVKITFNVGFPGVPKIRH